MCVVHHYAFSKPRGIENYIINCSLKFECSRKYQWEGTLQNCVCIPRVASRQWN